SSVYVDAVQPNTKEAARRLKIALGPHTLIARRPPEIAPYAQEASNPLTVVVVGNAFGGEVINPQAHIQPTPVHQAPAVRSDPGVTLGPTQQVRGRLHLPAYV